MSNLTRYSPELRERAVRMAIENRADYKSEWATFVGVSKLFGSPICRSALTEQAAQCFIGIDIRLLNCSQEFRICHFEDVCVALYVTA